MYARDAIQFYYISNNIVQNFRLKYIDHDLFSEACNYRIVLHSDIKSTCAVIISLTTAQNTSSLYAFIILGSDIYSLFLLQERVCLM